MEEEQQPIYNMPSMTITEGLLRQQIDATKEIEELENHLLGRIPQWDNKSNSVVYVENKDMRLINEKGMNYISSEVRFRVNKIFLLSHLTDEHIENITISFGRNIISAIFEHWDDWEIKKISDATSISGAVTDSFFVTLRKASFGKYLAYLRHTQSFSEIQSMRNEHEQAPSQKNAISNIPLIGRWLGK